MRRSPCGAAAAGRRGDPRQDVPLVVALASMKPVARQPQELLDDDKIAEHDPNGMRCVQSATGEPVPTR
jgi:hypothetical protein